MKTKAFARTARDWKNELRNQVRGHEGGDEMALVAWQILGGLIGLLAIVGVLSMLPELVRYLRIKRM